MLLTCFRPVPRSVGVEESTDRVEVDPPLDAESLDAEAWMFNVFILEKEG